MTLPQDFEEDDEERWQELFAKSQALLKALAEEANDDYRTGKTRV